MSHSGAPYGFFMQVDTLVKFNVLTRQYIYMVQNSKSVEWKIFHSFVHPHNLTSQRRIMLLGVLLFFVFFIYSNLEIYSYQYKENFLLSLSLSLSPSLTGFSLSLCPSLTCTPPPPKKRKQMGCLGGSVCWASGPWYRLRLWSRSCGIEPHVGLCAEHGVCSEFSLSLSLRPSPAGVLSLSLSLSK